MNENNNIQNDLGNNIYNQNNNLQPNSHVNPLGQTSPVMSNGNNNTTSQPKKGGNKGLAFLVILFIIVVLGGGGFYLYSNGFFGNKDKPKTDVNNKDDNKDDKKEKEGEIIKVDFTEYKSKATLDYNYVSLGTLKIKGEEYTVYFRRINCITPLELDYACGDTSNDGYYTEVGFGKKGDNTIYRPIFTNSELKEISVIDDRYVLVDTGDYNDRAPYYGDSMYLLDSTDSFKKVSTNVEKLQYVYNIYAKSETDSTTREVGYVDKNTIRVGACEDSTANNSEYGNKYVEYLITIKDGNIATKVDYSVDQVRCTAQMQ